MRRTAVQALNRLSRPEHEEEVLLHVARQYLDDYAIEALGRASLRALPELQDLLAEIGPGYAESKDLERAIRKLQRQWTGTKDD
jgi:prefoldin subunit 5